MKPTHEEHLTRRENTKEWSPLRPRAHGQTYCCGRHRSRRRRSSSLFRLPANVCRVCKISRRGAAGSFIKSKDGTEPSKLWGIKNSPDIRRRLAQPSLPEPLTVHSPLPSYCTTVTKRGRLRALCHGVMVCNLVWGVGQVGCPPWYTESITGVVFCTTQTSAFTSKHCLGEGGGIGAAGVGAAWGGRGSAEATSGYGGR